MMCFSHPLFSFRNEEAVLHAALICEQGASFCGVEYQLLFVKFVDLFFIIRQASFSFVLFELLVDSCDGIQQHFDFLNIPVFRVVAHLLCPCIGQQPPSTGICS
uniref:Uncharacterized protein n=1 Tax=Anguilla anguilla TaxID=7936 RepID=A0A0E9WCG1_ANGAN